MPSVEGIHTNPQTMKSWTKYGFEFLSIFIAVIAAFALDNWNDNRKERLAESKILIEVYNGLEKDMDDIKLNMFGHEQGIEVGNYFRALIAGQSVSTDTFLHKYFNLTRDFISIQNTSGYETLKSRGFELIDNDSLRTQIISLYEYDYNILRKMEEEYYEMQFQANYFEAINDALAPNFLYNEQNKIAGIQTPIVLPEREKKILLSYLWKMEANRRFMLGYYEEVKRKLEATRAVIAREIDRRE
jgi:hypothetical protein